MQSSPLQRPTLPFLGRGGFRTLVLRALNERPMHGYEVIKFLENRFQGFYRPSAGTVYPALRSLHHEGLVTVRGAERRKTYHLTAKGKARLRSQRDEMRRHFESFQAAVGPERAALLREVRDTGRLLMTNLKAVTPTQAVELRSLVEEMRARIGAVLAESGEVHEHD